MLIGHHDDHTHTHIGRYRRGSVPRFLLRAKRLSEPQQLSQAVLGQVVYQNRSQGSLRENKGREGFPGSFFNFKPFPEGDETPPLAIAVSDDLLHQVEALFSHLLGIHVREFSFYFHWAGSAL